MWSSPKKIYTPKSSLTLPSAMCDALLCCVLHICINKYIYAFIFIVCAWNTYALYMTMHAFNTPFRLNVKSYSVICGDSIRRPHNHRIKAFVCCEGIRHSRKRPWLSLWFARHTYIYSIYIFRVFVSVWMRQQIILNQTFCYAKVNTMKIENRVETGILRMKTMCKSRRKSKRSSSLVRRFLFRFSACHIPVYDKTQTSSCRDAICIYIYICMHSFHTIFAVCLLYVGLSRPRCGKSP